MRESTLSQPILWEWMFNITGTGDLSFYYSRWVTFIFISGGWGGGAGEGRNILPNYPETPFMELNKRVNKKNLCIMYLTWSQKG